ncbi:MAG: hypothetical protein ACTHNK_10115 [Thermomicrobiales bacterium]
MDDYEAPNAGAFVNGPVVHHFEEFGLRAYRPDCRSYLRRYPLDSCKAMPLDACYLATEGGGAAGTPGYLALEAYDAFEFYAESTPVWWIPGRLFDLRNTWATFYLKEIAPITVAEGFTPHLFIAAYVPHTRAPNMHLSAWYLKAPLVVGKDGWAYNEVLLTTDASQWVNYTTNPPEETLDQALGQCGFIGWMYMNGKNFRGVQATGTMGWDEFAFNLTEAELAAARAGQELPGALVF